MELRSIEFQRMSTGEVEVRHANKAPFILSESHRDYVTAICDTIRQRYPKAYDNLFKRYIRSEKNKTYHDFLIARGFCKCNMGKMDHILDIDDNGNWHLEYCDCPRAGECPEWKETCEPVEDLGLTDQQLRVLELIAEGNTRVQIADTLCISPKTVDNHTTNMLRKLNLHSNAELVRFWCDKNLR